MKEFSKDYFLAFFSHEHSKRIFVRPFLITFINVIIALFSVIFGPYFANQVSFASTLSKATTFEEVLTDVLPSELVINDGTISINYQYDSYTNDPNNYLSKNYAVILDTRDKATTFEDFSLVMSNEDGTENVSYEEYLSLDTDQKDAYHVVLNRTGKFLDTTANVAKYESYLALEEDHSTFDELKTAYNNGEYDLEEYADKLYVLYGQSYYPEDVYGNESFGEMPTLFSYYTSTLNNDYSENDYIFIYKDGIEASFKVNKKHVVFFGIFEGNSTYQINDSEVVQDLIVESFKNGNSYRRVTYFLIGFLIWFAMLVILLFVTLGFRVGLRLKDMSQHHYFLKILNLECSYLLYATIFSTIITILLGFVYGDSLLFINPVIMLVIVLIRTLAFYLRDKNFVDYVKDKD